MKRNLDLFLLAIGMFCFFIFMNNRFVQFLIFLGIVIILPLLRTGRTYSAEHKIVHRKEANKFLLLSIILGLIIMPLLLDNLFQSGRTGMYLFLLLLILSLIFLIRNRRRIIEEGFFSDFPKK